MRDLAAIAEVEMARLIPREMKAIIEPIFDLQRSHQDCEQSPAGHFELFQGVLL